MIILEMAHSEHSIQDEKDTTSHTVWLHQNETQATPISEYHLLHRPGRSQKVENS